MNLIKINKLHIYAYHGIHDYEKKYGQLFSVDFEYSSSHDFSNINDELVKTIDYIEIANQIENYFINNRFDLLESLANSLLDFIIVRFNLKYVKVSIKKISPLVKQNLESVEVELEKNA